MNNLSDDGSPLNVRHNSPTAQTKKSGCSQPNTPDSNSQGGGSTGNGTHNHQQQHQGKSVTSSSTGGKGDGMYESQSQIAPDASPQVSGLLNF